MSKAYVHLCDFVPKAYLQTNIHSHFQYQEAKALAARANANSGSHDI